MPVWSASAFSSISAKKLSDGLLVRAARRAIVGDCTVASTLASAGVLPARGAPRTGMSRFASAESRRAAANAGGLAW